MAAVISGFGSNGDKRAEVIADLQTHRDWYRIHRESYELDINSYNEDLMHGTEDHEGWPGSGKLGVRALSGTLPQGVSIGPV